MNNVLDDKSIRVYRSDIDGLRAIAILGVVLYHAGLPWLSGGFTGVDIFFVISGYLIGGHIFSEIRSGSFSFLGFYKRRAKRILPAFYLVIAFTFLAAVLLLSPPEVTTYANSAIASILSISNMYFYLRISDYFHTSPALNPLLMTWSLGVEEQFYALIPVLMVLIARIRRSLLFAAILVTCALSFIFACGTLGSHPNAAFYLLPARAWELGVGVALATAELHRKRTLLPPKLAQAASLVGMVLMLAPMYLLTSAIPFPGAAALPSVLGTALVIASPASWINRSLLSLLPLVFIGKISYSWYLWHWPLLAFLRVPSGGMLSPRGAMFAIAASFAASVLSYYLVEQPFRRSSRAPVPLLLRYAAVGLAGVCVLAVLRVSHGLPSRYPVLSRLVEPTTSECSVDFEIDKPDLSSRCYPASDSRPSVLLWGDSHSGVLAPILRQTASTQGYNFIQTSKSDCLPLKGAALYVSNHPLAAAACIHFNDTVLNLIETDRRIRIVVMAGVWGYPFRQNATNPLIVGTQYKPGLSPSQSVDGVFEESLVGVIRPLLQAGKQVILIDDVPTFGFDPLMRFETAYIPARLTLRAWFDESVTGSGLAPAAFPSASNQATDLLIQVKERFSGVELIDMKSKFCNSQNLCAYAVGNQLLFRDSNHVTTDGARYALSDFRFPDL